jgi:molybdate transport repressor ModE-like protein
MAIGAILITAGCGSAPSALCGGVTVAQRMIASLQRSGVAMIVVVTGPEDKKLEKQLAQSGVFFVQNHTPRQELLSVQLGQNVLSDKCDRYFLMRADRPLIDPDTLQKMKDVDAELVIPVHQGKRGQPLLLKSSCPVIGDMDYISRQTAVVVDVEDPGVLPGADEGVSLENRIALHDRKLTRPVMDFVIARGKPVLDGKLMTLLHLIRETQSVRDACSRMQISYSTAWNLLNAAEDSLGYPLILRNKGGPSGSGSLLTEKGSALLAAGEQFESAARENLEKMYHIYFGNLL